MYICISNRTSKINNKIVSNFMSSDLKTPFKIYYNFTFIPEIT